ncbi:hypothetical protein FB45DRAFT_893546 [Roridomyces roridus]|uniref:DBF4-type domain-containing protein n=1 Tax=Roridomyces roridus TaxID=1738132 RepID=A0AAD7CFH3_9AGAR|nr:hypothetical protein FB45DRAFT_893546 [Roridomyces roridus]
MATQRRTHPRAVSGTKRPRSPDNTLEILPKRLKAAPAGPVKEGDNDKARRHAEREQQRVEFKDKYRRAFPSWKFYFDLDNIHAENASSVKVAQTKIRQLGGSIENFFSNAITHFITDQTAPPEQPPVPSADKENDAPRFKLKSPIKLKGTAADDIGDLVSKARGFDNTKIWNIVKLVSVVDRCLEIVPVPPSTSAPLQRSLSTLLQSERLHGTSERDPTQKRHDYKYFGRGTYFMMVEDIREELATIAVQEYIIPKGRDAANAKVPWPVLHCHPQSRGPFLPFDEKEKRRWEKSQHLEKQEVGERRERELLRVEAMKRKAEVQLFASRHGHDLRRSVSLNNINRRGDEPGFIDLDGDVVDCGGRYIAASGNSVGITSTTGTTSTAGLPFNTSSLPASLRGRQEVVTSLKYPSVKARGGDMGPPISVPERRPSLKKSRSTNTMRLPKRDEGSKPGYCECCRQKFTDFNEHIAGRRHRKFAMDDSNFLQLDYILARVKRRTVQETQEEESEWRHKCAQPRSGDDDDDDTLMFSGAFVDLDS